MQTITSVRPPITHLLTRVLATLLVPLALLSACSPTANTGIGSAMMPSVAFNTLSGKQFDTASLKGNVVLVNFWATSCTTCVKEMPLLVQAYQTHSGKGFRTIAVAMDYDTPSFIEQFVKSRQLPFDVVHDRDGSLAKAFDGTKLTPTSYLIDKQGRIVKRYVGEPKHDEFNASIATLLAS